jgi:hypothetical protein
MDRHGPQPNQRCQQPKAYSLLFSTNDDCSPDNIQQKKKCSDRENGQPLPSRVRSLQGTLMRTRPTLPVSEGVVARISLDEQDDPDPFIPGTPKPINPAVLLTF